MGKCQVCGASTMFNFPLCTKCNELKEKGLIVKDKNDVYVKKEEKEIVTKEKSTFVAKKTEVASDKKDKKECIICGKSAQYDLCYEHYLEKAKVIEELASLQEFDEVNDYYNNLKYNIFKLKDMDYARTACVKLLALGEKLEKDFKRKDAIAKAKTDAISLLSKKAEYLESMKNKVVNEKEDKSKTTNTDVKDDRSIIEEEQGAKSDLLDYRRAYPMSLRCKDGHYVRSKSEKMLDDYFTSKGLFHYYEKRVVNEDNDETYFPDFFLPTVGNANGTFVEYFGLEDNPSYVKTEKKKIDYYKKAGLDVIEVREKNISLLEEFMDDQIRAMNHKYKK